MRRSIGEQIAQNQIISVNKLKKLWYTHASPQHSALSSNGWKYLSIAFVFLSSPFIAIFETSLGFSYKRNLKCRKKLSTRDHHKKSCGDHIKSRHRSNKKKNKQAGVVFEKSGIKYAGWSDAAKIVMSPSPDQQSTGFPSSHKWHKIKNARVLNGIEQ